MSTSNKRFFAYRRVVVEVSPTTDASQSGGGGATGAEDNDVVGTAAPGLLELSGEERELVSHILDVYKSDLRMEISATDNPRMRRALRHEEELLKALLTRLR